VSLFNRKPPPQFDLVFMDIIMPRLDGVSATACIRDHLPQAPIIAMTSNIRQEDVAYYFKHGMLADKFAQQVCPIGGPTPAANAKLGMNDVLAKPFTKDGMLRMLKKHLPHLLNHASPQSSDMGTPYTPIAGGAPPMNPMGAPSSIATTSLSGKFDGTPIQSPATTTGTASWHSPGPAPPNHTSPGASPLETGSYVGVNNSGQLVMAPATIQRPGFMATTMGPPAGSRPDLDDRPEKRQRIKGSQRTYVQ
jgi:osomolarity two-component system response regulator SKN7